MNSVHQRPLTRGEWVRLFVVMVILGPLLGTILFFFATAITEGNQTSVAILFSPALIYASLYAVPAVLLAFLFLVLVRKRLGLDLWKTMLCGAIGGFIPFFILITSIGGFTPGLLSGLIGAALGAAISGLLWLLRHVFGLSAL